MELERDGAELSRERLRADELAQLADLFEAVGDRPGKRVHDRPEAAAIVGPGSTLLGLAQRILGTAAKPVRLVLFDKTATRNWSVAWHQDRTIAVKARREIEGFGPWSVKQGIQHVAPPYAVLAQMITVRAHLDPCDADNAPLIVALGSHSIGAIAADQAAEAASGFEQATCMAEAGEIWTYRTPILHTSAPAVRPTRRRVIQVDFAAADLPGGLEWAGV